MRRYSTIKVLLVIVGLISVGLGMIGIFVPLLPTTPFLLLASYCFIRSSARLHNWLMNHKIFGRYLKNYLLHHAVARSVKIGSISILWLSITTSLVIINNLYVRIVLLIVLLGVTTHLARLKVIKTE